MDISKKLERKLIGLAVFFILFCIVSYFNGNDQDKTTKEIKSYLQSAQFNDDFKQNGNPKIDTLVTYPQITFYFTFEYYDHSRTYSKEEMQSAENRKCDFILSLFDQLKANPAKKKRILKTLADENIVVKNIYRNKYAEVMYSTEISLKTCDTWYPKT